MILALFFVCSASIPTNFLLGLSPIVPENVFDQSEINKKLNNEKIDINLPCLLNTSDAADE